MTVSECINVDIKGMLGCLTGVGDVCCYVIGIEGCSLKLNGESLTTFSDE